MTQRILRDPMIRIDAPVSGSTTLVTILATDIGTGIKFVGYQIDRGEPTDYTGPFKLDVSRPHEIYIVADDRAGNRSSLIKELKVGTSTNGSDPFKIRSIPF